MSKPLSCLRCLKPTALCVCEWIQTHPTQLEVLILQHPQEPKQALSSAHLAHLCLLNSTLRIGLSWPGLSKALGKQAMASEWVVFYLGSGLKEPQKPFHPSQPSQNTKLLFLSQKGKEVPQPAKIKGVVVLDGTWSQAKTLWWRNPWLLKLSRAILHPQRRSLYQELRKEPRPECISTLETLAEGLTLLGEKEEVGSQLHFVFQELLKKKRSKNLP